MGAYPNVGTFACGSITDGTSKLEVRTPSIQGVGNFQKGQKLSLTGTIEAQGKLIIILRVNKSGCYRT